MSAILGPISTLVAAIAASFITWRFASQQARTAKQQADTALDQLRYNLFEKRYAIYNTAKEMIKYIVNQGSANDVGGDYGDSLLCTGRVHASYTGRAVCRSAGGFGPGLPGFEGAAEPALEHRDPFR